MSKYDDIEGAYNANQIKTPEEILADRQKTYGDPLPNWNNIGRSWGAILSQHFNIHIPDIPADVAQQMMVLMKAIRSVNKGVFHEDNYDDEQNYTNLARESKRKIESGNAFNDFQQQG